MNQTFPLFHWYANRSFRVQLLLLVAPFMVGTLLIIGFIGVRILQNDREAVEERLNQETNDLADRIDEPFLPLYDNIQFLKVETAVIDYATIYNLPPTRLEEEQQRQENLTGSLPRIASDFQGFMQGRSLYSQIRLLDTEGVELVKVSQVRGTAQFSSDLQDVHRENTFVQALTLRFSSQVWVSEVHYREDANGIQRPLMEIVTPIADTLNSENIAGYLVIELNLEDVFDYLREQDIDKGFAYLVDADGYYLGHSLNSQRDLLFGRDTDQGDQLTGESARTILTYTPAENIRLSLDDTDYLAHTAIVEPLRDFADTPNAPIWTIVVAEPRSDLTSQTRLLVLALLVIFGVLVAITMIWVWTEGDQFASRLEVVYNELKRVYLGDLSAHLPEKWGNNEFTQLATGFNQMTERLSGLVSELETRVEARIRDLDLVAEITREVAGLRNLDLILNRAINRIVERFEFYHAQVFLVDEAKDYAVLVASTGDPGQRLLAKRHKLAVGSESVIGRVSALGITVIAGDTQSSEVPWQPNTELPDTRSEMALPLKVEQRVIGALDIQSKQREAFGQSDIEIFQVLADQLAIAINNARLIGQLQNRVDEVNRLNQQMVEKVWVEFGQNEPQLEPFAYRYNLINVETVPSNGQETTIEGSFSAAIEIGGNQIGEINTAITEGLTSEKVALIEAIANRVALAIDNARLVQETQTALAEAQRLYEMARTVNSVAELDIQGIYNPIIDQLVFEPRLEQVAILLAVPIPSYLASHLEVAHMWRRTLSSKGWTEGDQLNLLQQGLVERLEVAPRSSIVVQNRAILQSIEAPPALAAIMDTLGAETVLLVPMMTGSRWFGLVVCASSQPNAFSENFINFTGAVADQMTIAVDNRRLFNEVQDEARRALALAEAGQLVSQISGDLESGLSRLFRVISGPAEFDRWWFGLVETGGQRLRQVAAATPTTAFPQTVDLASDHNTLTESVLLRQVMLVNEFDQEHPVLGKISPEYRLTYGKHLAVPVMVGDDLLGVLLLGRAPTLRDFDERDVQFASTLASQLAVATENQRLFSQIEAQRQTLQSTIEAMPAGILVLDVDGRVLLYNEQVLEMLGRGVKQGIYQPSTYTIRYVGTDEPVDIEDFPTTQAIKTKSRIATEGLYVDLPDGSRLDLLINVAPIFGDDGQLASIVSIYQEITELRELELALQASLSETTALYEASRSVAAATSPEELIAAIVDQVQSLVPDKIFVMFREGQEEGDMRTRVAGVWPDVDRLPSLEEIGISDELLMTDSSVILNDAPVLHGTGLRAFASLPLKARGERILGWFSVGYVDNHEFSSEEKRYLATLADQAAVGLDVIRLFESTRNALRSVANLYRGSQHISDAQGIAEAVDVMRDELMAHFAPDRIDLLIQQNPEDTDLLYAPMTWKSEDSLVNVPALPVDPVTLEPQADFNLMSREEFYIQDMSNPVDNDLQRALRTLDTPYQALLSVPLRVSGRTVGRLAIGFLKPRKFTPDDPQFITMLADSVAYIVENELLFQQTQDSLEETGVLYQASRAIANAETREDVVQAMIDYAASAVVDKVMLITLLTESWDDHNSIIEVTATWGRGEFLDLKGLRFSRDQLPIWDQLAASEIVWSDDIENDPKIDDNSRLGGRTLDVASFVVVPLQAQGRAIGSVMLASSQPRVHAEREIRIYQALADQAAVQLENKRLFEQAEFRTRQLSASAEVARDATSILNLDELFPRIVNLIRDAFGYDHAQIFMLDEDNERAVLRAATGEAGRQLLSIGHNLKVGSHSVVGRTCLNAEPFMVNDTSEADVVHRPNPYLPETRAELAIPLIVKGQVRGVIDVQSNLPRAFSNEDVQILTTLADQIAVAIDNAQLFEISQHLYQASRAIANAKTREDIVQAMIDYAAPAVVDKAMLIKLLAESWDSYNAVIEATATWGNREFLDLKGLRFSRDQLPIWDQLSASEILWSDNIENDAKIDDNSRLGCRTLDVVSFVVVPLQAQGRAIGSIILASSQPRVHTSREIRIYQALADQAAVQLENKRLFEQAEFRTRQLSASAEVARDATSILNLDELFPRIVNLICDAFGYDHAQIFMLDEDNEHAVLRAATGEAGRQLLSIGHTLEVGSHSVVGRTCLNAEPFMVNDTAEADVVHRPNPYLPETRAELAIPLIVKGQVRGVIDVQSNQPRAFSNEDVQILTTLADQIAVAIDNAQLFEISQQRAADMTLLFDVTSTAAAATSLAETLETVITLLVRQLRGQEAAMFIYDPTDNALHSQVVVIAEQTGQGVEYRFLDDVHFVIPYGSGVVGAIAQNHQPYIVNDFEQEPRYIGSQTKTRSGIYVPLVSGSNVLGVMAIEGSRPGQFNEDDMRLLQTLSTSLTAIIKNLQLLDELQLAIDRLREVDQLKTNFLAAMSHELRTPLNSIIGFSRVILKGIDGPITDMQRQDIQTIHDSGKHLLGLVNDILDQAKIEAGKMELVREYFDVKTIVKGVMATAIGFTKEKPVQLYTNIEDDLPQGFGDEFRTRQIILNLVSNAAKFTTEGNVTTNAYASTDEETGQKFITISVADTGIGIAKENLTRIFESFQQVDNTTTRTVEGTGLGLPLARSLAELQGGKIWVESEPGMGSTFFVTIPTSPQATDTLELEAAVIDEKIEVAPIATDPNDTKPLRQRKTVLAVDDELGMIDLYRRYLAKEGWQVIGITNPEQAEEMVALHSPQLILLDINMPQRTGWDVLEHLKQSAESSDIPIIVCSIETDVSRSAALGAASHLVKPFVETDLLRVVRQLT